MTVIESLCGNHIVYGRLLEWLKIFDYSQDISVNSCAFVLGSSCIGKSYSVNKICKHLDLFIFKIDCQICYDAIQFKDMLFKGITSSLVQNLENTNKNKVILIDNFDILYTIDKNVKNVLIKMLNSRVKNVPIICIGNMETMKNMVNTVNVPHKTITFDAVFQLEIPSRTDITNVLKSQGVAVKKIKQLLDNSDDNLTRIFELIGRDNMIKYSHSDPTYDIMHLYDYGKYDRNTVVSIVASDSWQIPLRFYENLITELQNRSIKLNIMNQIYADFVNHLCLYNLYLNKHQETALDIFAGSIYPIMMCKKKTKTSTMNRTTKISNYLSLQKKQVKNTYNSTFPFYQLGNYHIHLLDRKFICFN